MEHPLRAYRVRKNIIAEVFGARVGVSKSTISRIENGKHNFTRDLVRRIVDETGGEVTAEQLVSYVERAA